MGGSSMALRKTSKKTLICIPFFIGLSLLITPLFKEGKISEERFFLNAILDPSDPDRKPRTGDLLLWSTTSMKSILIQEMTDGPYSHCALLYRDAENRVWALDVYPGKGLRYMTLEEYLKPPGERPIVRAGLIRYQGPLDTSIIEQEIKRLV